MTDHRPGDLVRCQGETWYLDSYTDKGAWLYNDRGGLLATEPISPAPIEIGSHVRHRHKTFDGISLVERFDFVGDAVVRLDHGYGTWPCNWLATVHPSELIQVGDWIAILGASHPGSHQVKEIDVLENGSKFFYTFDEISVRADRAIVATRDRPGRSPA